MKKCIPFVLFLSMSLSTGYLSAQQAPGKPVSRKVSRTICPEDEDYKNFRFTVGGGYAYWLGKSMKTGDNKLDDFSSGLRNGYNLDIEAQYFFKEHIGIGLNTNFVKQSNSESGTLNIPNVGPVDNYKESNELVYVGASCVLRFENEKWGFYAGAGFGPIFYTNTGEIPAIQLSISKTAFGSYISVAGERRFNHNAGAGLKIAATSGTLKIDGLDDRLSVSNLMITGFISFRTK